MHKMQVWQKAAVGIFCIEIGKIIADGNNRITLIALVEGVKQFAVWTHNSDFNGRAAGINTDKGFAGLLRGTDSDTFLRVTRLKNSIFAFVFKQRRQMFKAVLCCCCLQLFWQRGKVHLVLGTEGCTHCYIKQAVFRADTFDIQNTVKGIAQTAHKGERTAKIQHIAADGTAFGKTGDGLACYSVEDAGCQVAFFRTLVEQRLDVGLGEHAAARGDGVDFGLVRGKIVHLGGGQLQKRGHLVDEGAGAARAAAVHAHLHVAGDEQDLRILAAQLDHHVGAGQQALDGDARGVDLLHERDAHALGKAHARRAGDAQLRLLFLREVPGDAAQHRSGLLRDLGIVPLVILIYDLVLIVQHDALQGRGPYVQANPHHRVLVLLISGQSVFISI